MDGSDFVFDYKQKVRLKDRDFSEYIPYMGLSTVGCEGWITQRRRDRLGLPEVFIEWDHEDWRYNNAPDCWTYQEHFEPVEERIMEPSQDEQLQGAVQAFADHLKDIFKVSDPEPDKQEVQSSNPFAQSDPGEPTLNSADQAIYTAAQLLSNSEAFVVIGVVGGVPHVVPYSTTQDAALIASTHMSRLAAKAHESLARLTIEKSKSK